MQDMDMDEAGRHRYLKHDLYFRWFWVISRLDLDSRFIAWEFRSEGMEYGVGRRWMNTSDTI